jgi:hypothetical protein
MSEMAPYQKALVSGGVTYEIKKAVGPSFTNSYKTVYISQTVGYKAQISSTTKRLWPVEEEALEDIMTGKVKMVRQSGEVFLKELNDVLNE